LKPNGGREIAEKTALVRVEQWTDCANGRESNQFTAGSRSFAQEASPEELRAAIAAVTRALASSQERDEVFELVQERAALRREVQALDQHVEERTSERVA